MDVASELRKPKNNPRGATARAVYQTVVSELDARLARLTGSAG